MKHSVVKTTLFLLQKKTLCIIKMPSISTSLSELMREEEKVVEKIQNFQLEISDRKSNDKRDRYFELLEQNINDLKQRQKEIRLWCTCFFISDQQIQ